MSEMNVRQKVSALFQYIKEFSNLKRRIIRNINEQYWSKRFADIPLNEKYITFHKEIHDDLWYDDATILSVTKPELSICPEPHKLFAEWLKSGWNDPYKEVALKEYLTDKTSDERDRFDNSDENSIANIRFEDDPQRVAAYGNWIEVRNRWAVQQQELIPIRNLFISLYELHLALGMESDTKDLLVGCGVLRDLEKTDLSHPILTKRVKLEFDALSNTVQILDTDATSELYTSLLTSIDEFNLEALPTFAEEISNLSSRYYHPLNKDNISAFLRQLLHSLSADSQYSEERDADCTERFQLTYEPVFFVRTRNDGTIKAIEDILKDIENNGEIPAHIGVLTGHAPVVVEEDIPDKSLPVQLAEVGGEDIDILLTKPANKEQLEIARRISKYDGVLVQGPPGTGKTHTIANLLGHFLAQGKTVLVTSHTKKALTVVKDKVEKALQDLCVTMLDDNNSDMEKSVDGITDMISRNSLHQLRENIQITEENRRNVIKRLAEVRQMIFDIQNSEFSPIVIAGESISPAKAALFINAHPEYDVIPGKVELYRVLPLSYKELQELYSSNTSVSIDEENELSFNLPNEQQFLSPSEFADLVNERQQFAQMLNSVCAEESYRFSKNLDGSFELIGENGFSVGAPSQAGLNMIENLLKDFSDWEEWMIYAAVDGRKGRGYLKNWQTMIAALREIMEISAANVEVMFGKQIAFAEQTDFEKVRNALPEILRITKEKGKLNTLNLLFHSDFKYVCSVCRINGAEPKDYEDYCTIDSYLQLQKKREACARYWDQLMACHGVAPFAALDADKPEAVAVKMIPEIEKYLSWYHSEYPQFVNALRTLGICEDEIFFTDVLTNDVEETQQLLVTVQKVFPVLAAVLRCDLRISEIDCLLDEMCQPLVQNQREQSDVCRTLHVAIQEQNVQVYEQAYYRLQLLYAKYSVLKQRKDALAKLYSVAPDWTYAIRNRVGIHGQSLVPENIDQIWRWKQYDEILKALTKESLPALQRESARLSQEYRTITAELAKWKAWYELKRRIDGNLELKSSLQSWRLLTQRTGKARKMTGIYRKEAQEHMAKCQEAIPVWIVPMSKALENFTPGKNGFDVIIVDEASQSSITALAVTYMGKKVIVVGDDKQVSPTGVGLDIDKMIKLAEGTIKDVIPAWSLYTGNSSLYDIVSTAYPSLMLREHFRCMPDIIGYCNKLSYDYKIKPLRDTSDSKLLPAVVNYRTKGHRNGHRKQNDVEARTIVALIKACIENDAYRGKTFGIISLLGDEQPNLISKYLLESVDTAEIEKRKIIYGSPAQFQGDERDVIFLSLVDSNESDGPLHLMGYGTDDMFRKRYNVAVSRAKDQLWVVHSLDSTRDLKEGDLRKDLLEYAKNPQAFQQQIEQISKNAESVFEDAVGKALVAKGYAIKQQWPVGSYRLDIVAIDGKEKVAIECDGERWHSSETQVRNDMERQTILERLGWRFIRIRGSEYFRDPEKTMERVYQDLETYNIHPSRDAEVEATPDTDLLSEIKRRAQELLEAECIDNVAEPDNVIQDAPAPEPEKTATPPVSARKKDVPAKPVIEAPVQIDFFDTVMRSVSEEKAPPTRERKKSPDVQKTEPKPVEKATRKPKERPSDSKLQKPEQLLLELKNLNVEVIDNRKQSKILWVIRNPETEDRVVELLKRYGCKYTLDRRGAIATQNRPAWRVTM